MTIDSDSTNQKQGKTPGGTRSPPRMFSVSVHQRNLGEIIILGKPTRNSAWAHIKVPVTPELHKQLRGHVVGPLAMGTAALLEWALDELDSRSISVEAHGNAQHLNRGVAEEPQVIVEFTGKNKVTLISKSRHTRQAPL